ALLERGMAIAIIGGALVRVFEDLVGLVDFLEAMLGVLVAGIAIGMAHHRLLAEGGFDVTVSCSALDRERFVVAALGHHCVPDDVQSFKKSVKKNTHPRLAGGGADLQASGIERSGPIR